MPRASWCLLAFIRKSAMLEDLTEISGSVLFSIPIPAPLLALLSSVSLSAVGLSLLLLLAWLAFFPSNDRLSGKMDRGSVKDKLLFTDAELLLTADGRPPRDAWGAAGVPWPPSNVFTSKELLNPDRNGLKLPPNAATTAAYYKKTKVISTRVMHRSDIWLCSDRGLVISD